MAKRVVETLVDDLDGSDADRTISFTIDGEQYAIDLSKSNAEKFDAALAPFVSAARRTGASRATAGRRGASSAGDTKDAREWLRSNGHQVSDRGRIPAPLLELYRSR